MRLNKNAFNRRDFISRSSLFGAGIIRVAGEGGTCSDWGERSSVWQPVKIKLPMRLLSRYTVTGVGRMGRKYLKALRLLFPILVGLTVPLKCRCRTGAFKSGLQYKRD